MANSTIVNGERLAIVIDTSRKSQAQIAQETGIGESTLSRWKQPGVRTMRQTGLARLAKALGMSPADLESQVAAHCEEHGAGATALQPAERELLAMYRKLSPRAQAEVFLQFLEIVEKVSC